MFSYFPCRNYIIIYTYVFTCVSGLSVMRGEIGNDRHSLPIVLGVTGFVSIGPPSFADLLDLPLGLHLPKHDADHVATDHGACQFQFLEVKSANEMIGRLANEVPLGSGRGRGKLRPAFQFR